MENKNNTMLYVGIAAVVVVLIIGYFMLQPASPAPVTDNTQTPDTATPVTPGAVVPGQEKPVWDKDHYVYIMNYNNDTITPSVLTINRGDNVKFVNKDNLTMRISATLSATSSANYTDSHSVGKGGTYALSFSVPGIWLITNLNGSVKTADAVVFVLPVPATH